jgi:hypothetical protein
MLVLARRPASVASARLSVMLAMRPLLSRSMSAGMTGAPERLDASADQSAVMAHARSARQRPSATRGGSQRGACSAWPMRQAGRQDADRRAAVGTRVRPGNTESGPAAAGEVRGRHPFRTNGTNIRMPMRLG